ncbi:hypothetical protein [Chlorogloeopsis sp. ULAP02]|uniref:hypothetical protein n=1 Tax=Chlorogloeopsis sp. ULAP02 TaxID=3107926 RepID=UPI0031353110
MLYLYKEPGDKPLHALGAELWLLRRKRFTSQQQLNNAWVVAGLVGTFKLLFILN